jgi:hypothetical protein
MTRYLFLLSAILAFGCGPNRAILESNQANSVAANEKANATPDVPVKKITIGELMERTAKAPEDSFTFPCTLHMFKPEDRDKLKKLREQWLAKEDDARYIMSTCVCPGICVIKVSDVSKPGPNNSGLIAIKGLDSGYQWIGKDMDLTNTTLTWASTVPYLNFDDAEGKRLKTCTVEDKAGKIQLACK